MNSPALILQAYISDFCRRINKFTCGSIMHDFIFILSTREVSTLSVFAGLHTLKLAVCWKLAVHTVCAQPNSVYSAKRVRNCITVRLYNETVIVKRNCRLPSRQAEATTISKSIFIICNYWVLSVTEASEAPSLICLLQSFGSVLMLERRSISCGLYVALKTNNRLHINLSTSLWPTSNEDTVLFISEW